MNEGEVQSAPTNSGNIPQFFNEAMASNTYQVPEQGRSSKKRLLIFLGGGLLLVALIVVVVLFSTKAITASNQRKDFNRFANYILFGEENADKFPAQDLAADADKLNALFWDNQDSVAFLARSKELLDKVVAHYDKDNLPEQLKTIKDDVAFLYTYSNNMPVSENTLADTYKKEGDKALSDKVGELCSVFYSDDSQTSVEYVKYYHIYLDIMRENVLRNDSSIQKNSVFGERLEINRFILKTKNEIRNNVYSYGGIIGDGDG